MTGIQQTLMGVPRSPFLYDIILSLGLGSNLLLCLDAADTRSYDGTSQTWTDIALANNFFRGTTGSAQGSDPTFVGTAGVADENTYFSLDGGDQFTNVTNGAPDSDQIAHDNGAGSALFMWYNDIATSSDAMWAADDDGGGHNAFAIWLIASGANDRMIWRLANDNAGSITPVNSTLDITRDAWHMLGVDYVESATDVTFVVDTATETLNTTASTRTDTTALTHRIGTDVGFNTVPAGCRIACAALWGANIGTAAFADIYTRLKTYRFTSLP